MLASSWVKICFESIFPFPAQHGCICSTASGTVCRRESRKRSGKAGSPARHSQQNTWGTEASRAEWHPWYRMAMRRCFERKDLFWKFVSVLAWNRTLVHFYQNAVFMSSLSDDSRNSWLFSRVKMLQMCFSLKGREIGLQLPSHHVASIRDYANSGWLFGPLWGAQAACLAWVWTAYRSAGKLVSTKLAYNQLFLFRLLAFLIWISFESAMYLCG